MRAQFYRPLLSAVVFQIGLGLVGAAPEREDPLEASFREPKVCDTRAQQAIVLQVVLKNRSTRALELERPGASSWSLGLRDATGKQYRMVSFFGVGNGRARPMSKLAAGGEQVILCELRPVTIACINCSHTLFLPQGTGFFPTRDDRNRNWVYPVELTGQVTVRVAGAAAKEGRVIATRKITLEKAANPEAEKQAAVRLHHWLGKGFSELPSFRAIEEDARDLNMEALTELIEKVRPLGVYGNAGWIRCALFAEWGRRDPGAALDYLLDPPALKEPFRFQNEGWEERQAFFSLFRGWAEMDLDAAIARLKQGVNKSSFWHDRAYEELFQRLASREGPKAWDQLPVELGRGGALQGLFRGLRTSEDRLAAVTRWRPELESSGGLGYKLGPERLKEVRFTAQNVHSQALFYRAAALALAEVDLAMGLEWIQKNTRSPQAGPLMVPILLRLWAASRPAEAMVALKAGEHDRAALIEGILLREPQQAPQLITSIEDLAQRRDVLNRVIDGVAADRGDILFPAPFKPNLRPQAAESFRSLNEAIAVRGFDESTTQELRSQLRRDFRRYLKLIAPGQEQHGN